MTQDLVQKLKDLQPQHEYFIGIDSDGCVFDTMEIKQKECFIPQIVKHFNMQSVSKYLRESVEFVNLYSKWRGINRFPALLHSMDFLAERPEVAQRGVEVPGLSSLRKWVEEESQLGNPVLKAKVAETNDPVLTQALEWSLAVNEVIADIVKGVGPFANVEECLNKAKDKADLLVVSQTPVEALEREWEEHKLDHLVRVICGQEYGTKKEHIQYAAGGKYTPDHMLMIGDAPGDLRAAEGNQALFFPINPGDEDDSWARLLNEGLDRFFAGTFAGDYQRDLIARFEALLPDVPPWKMK
ncbi:HAD family hydrolase [bacterium]|nr:HAD family hydrolase [bacterium]